MADRRDRNASRATCEYCRQQLVPNPYPRGIRGPCVRVDKAPNDLTRVAKPLSPRAPQDRAGASNAALATVFLDTDPETAPMAPQPSYRKGVSIDRYTIVDEVGTGGMGTVYAAYDPGLDRRVAIKVLKPTHNQSRSTQRRLVREARALARLSHPNVVHVYDVGVHNDNVFVVMELIIGRSLKRWSRRKPPPHWRDVLAAYIAAGRGLMAAHDKGLIHRDFKPANVLMSDDGLVKVVDFGLAAANSRYTADNDKSSVTRSGFSADVDEPTCTTVSQMSGRLDQQVTMLGTVLGTPVYMAPEQHLDRNLGPHSDQYSFCVSLYESLYGYLPISSQTFKGLLERKQAQEIKAPPKRTDVPCWVHQAIMRGLRADPNERWPSMRSLLEALQRDPARRRRRWLTAVGLAMGFIGSMTVLLMVTAGERSGAASVCEGGENALGPDSAQLTFPLSNFAASPMQQGRLDQADPHLHRRAPAVAERRYGPKHLHLSVPLGMQGELLAQQGRPTEALAVSRRALSIVEQNLGPRHHIAAAQVLRLAMNYARLGHIDDAMVLAERGLRISKASLRRPQELAQALFDVARILTMCNRDRTRAIELARQAEQILAGSEARIDRTLGAEIATWLGQYGGCSEC